MEPIIHSTWEKIDEQTLKGFTTEEKIIFRRLLLQVLQNIEDWLIENIACMHEEYIHNEKNLLDSQFEEMKQMIEENSSISDRMDKMQLLSYLQMAKKKVSENR